MADYEPENVEQEEGGSTSQTLHIKRIPSIPSLPTPRIDEIPLMDQIFTSSSLSNSSPDPLRAQAQTVEKLASENDALEQKLQEMQKRLEAAQAKTAALAQKKAMTQAATDDSQ